MSLNRVFQASDLFGPPPPPAAAPVRAPVINAPKLDLAWGSFHQGIGSSLRAIFTRSKVPRSLRAAGFFRDSWIERRIPRRALVAAALWHVVFVVMPSPRLPAAARHY